MDSLLGGLDGRLRISITDSPMMWIVQSAMDKAHRKLKSKTGVISRLHEISKFYELAIMQLEGCMKFVQAETQEEEEEDSNALENGQERVLTDLAEIRDRLQGRLKESELAIFEKDRELMERFENELRLRKALEKKENELGSLHADMEIKRSKSDGVAELILSKHDVDQQVWNIKQQLDPDFSINSSRLITDDNCGGDSHSSNIDNVKIEQMGSDINFLKETLDNAFGKMHNAILMSDIEPLEQQWMWNIERECVGIVIKGFMKDLEGHFGKFGDLMKQVELLRDELKPFRDEEVVVGCKLSAGLKKSLSEGENNEEDGLEGDREENGHYVAKMIKNHESIIQKKSEELNWLKKEEMLQEKGCAIMKKGKDDDDDVGLKTRIQQVIVKLDNVINFGGKDKRIPELDATDREIFGVKSLEDVWDKINKGSVSHAVKEELHDEIRELRLEKDDSVMLSMLSEEIYVIIFRGLITEFYSIGKSMSEDYSCKEMINKVEAETREEIYYTICNETVKEYNYECVVEDKIFRIVFDETIKDIAESASHKFSELNIKVCNDIMYDSELSNDSSLEIAEYLVRENVYTILLKEIVNEWNKRLYDCVIDGFFREEINRFVFVDTYRDTCLSFGETETAKQGNLVRNDIYADKIEKSTKQTEILNDDENETSISSTMDTVLSETGTKLVHEVNTEERIPDFLPTADIVHDRKPLICKQMDEDVRFSNQLEPILRFSQVFVDFEHQTHEKMGNHILRLDEVKHHLDSLVELVTSLRKRELLYKMAFFRRCENLRKAENEVDMLGDQVDVLLGLLENIYVKLHQYSPLLQQHFEVSDILNLIENELTRGMSCCHVTK